MTNTQSAVTPPTADREPLTAKHPPQHVKTLASRNLACWCKPGAPCHADVLLDLANA